MNLHYGLGLQNDSHAGPLDDPSLQTKIAHLAVGCILGLAIKHIVER